MTRAARVIAFIERYCVTPDGAQVGQPLRLGRRADGLMHGDGVGDRQDGSVVHSAGVDPRVDPVRRLLQHRNVDVGNAGTSYGGFQVSAPTTCEDPFVAAALFTPLRTDLPVCVESPAIAGFVTRDGCIRPSLQRRCTSRRQI